MATISSPSPSPSGSSTNRRLSELLEEQQEPFSLDLYLLDRGCSTALLDAAGASSSACWPRSRSAARTPRRLAPAIRKTRGLLRLVLSKILRGTAAAPKKIKKQQQPVAIDWPGGAVDGEKLRNNRKNAAPSSPSPRRLHDAVKDDMEEEEEDEDDDDDDDPRQLSPVSVLKQRPFQPTSPAHTQKAMAIFSELLAAAYTPAFPDHLSRDSNNTSTTTASTPAPAPAPIGRGKNSAAAVRWQEKLEEEVAKVHDLASETAGGERACARDVGADVADAVLDELVVELAVELIGNNIGHDDHVDAIDVARCGWCS